MEKGTTISQFGISTTNPLYVKADLMAKKVYEATKNFPRDEMYGLTSQLRRAALSVILNIIEGFARQGVVEFRRFLIISFGSLKETTYLLYFAQQQKYLSVEAHTQLANHCEELSKIIWTIINPKK